MSVPLHFCTATSDDSSAISALILRCAERFLLADFSPQGQELLRNSIAPNAITQYLAQGLYYQLAFADCDTGRELVAVLALKRPCHLYHLFVEPRWHSRGIARQQFDAAWPHIERWAAEAGVDYLTVNSSLYAAPVYLRWGFVPESPPRDRGGVIDQPMRLQLSHYVKKPGRTE